MAQDMPPLLSHAPWRQLYTLYRNVLRLFIRLPAWLVLSAVPYSRQHPTWSFTQSLMVRLIYDVVDEQSRIGRSDAMSLDPGKDGANFQIIEPFSKELYQVPLVSSTVEPAKVGGVWFPEPPADPKGIIVLWVHGGAFVTCDGRSDMCGYMASKLLQINGVDAVFSIQYRLSGYGGSNPFPAALQDVLTAYLHLTQTLNISPDSIAIGGDSAGGNLVIAFLRYVESVKPALGRPSCAAVISPWVNPLRTLQPDYVHTKERNHSTDYLPPGFLQWGAKTYRPRNLVIDESVEAYITPLGHPFATAVPILSTFGQCELLGPDIVAWTEEMRSTSGNKVDLHCDINGVHDILIPGDKMGWDESAEGIALKIGELIQRSRKVSDK